MIETLRALYGYTKWANDRVLEAAERLTAEQLHAPGTAGQGSVIQTLRHLVETHGGWLCWWDGSLPAAEAYGRTLDPAEFNTLAVLRREADRVADQTQAFLDTLSEQDGNREYAWQIPDGPLMSMTLWKMMVHVANHGTQHRSEVAAMLTAAGASPGNLDALFYFYPRPGQ
ncbi:MAG: DinB family protein [Chloroflexota bacterium]